MEFYRSPMLGGVNLLSDPSTIRDDELARATNLVPVRPGVLQTRPAIENQFVIPVNAVLARPVSACFGPWIDSPLFLQTYYGNTSPFPTVKLSAFTLDGTNVMSDMTVVSLSEQQEYRSWTFQFANRIYFLTGFHSAGVPAYSIGRGEFDLTPFTFAGTGNADLRPKVAVPYRNRLVWANFGVGYENTLVFSDNFAPNVVGDDVLATNGRNVSLVAASDGDEIIGLAQVMLTGVGTPVETALLVLRRYTSYLLTGEPDQTSGGTISLAVNSMSVAAGCCSPWSIQSTPYGTIWAGQDEVWCFQGGQLPRPIGTKIRPALERTPRDLSTRVSAVYFDGFYRLVLFGDSQRIRAVDGITDQWWLDLRNGLPQDQSTAQWWGPQQFQFGGIGAAPSGIMARDDRPGGTHALYGYEIGRDVTGPFTVAPVVVKYDVDGSVDVIMADNATNTPDYTIDYTIKPDLITKEHDLGDPMLQKIYDGMEANVWASQSGRLLVQGVLDGGASYAETNIDVTAAGYEAGVDTIGTTGIAMPHAPQAVAAYDVTRPLGTAVQLRLQGQAGFFVDDTNNEFAAIANNDIGDDPIPFVAVLTTGFYTTYTAFMTMLVIAINAELGDAQYVYNTNGTISLGRNTGGDCSIEFLFVTATSPSTATAAQIEKTARIGAMLGMDTSANGYVFGTSPIYITGAMPVWNYTTPIWEINGLGMRLEAIPRRP